MRGKSWRVDRWRLLLAFLVIAGCSRGPKYELAEVKGVVKYHGRPVPNVQVEFLPEPKDQKVAALGPRSSGVTDKDGRYTLATDDQRPGAVVGAHRVLVRDLQMTGNKFVGRKADSDNFKFVPSRVPTVYGDPANSPLKRQVKAEPQTIDLDLKANP
jgi:hypothetical protein